MVSAIADDALGTSHDVESDGYVLQLPEMWEINDTEFVLLPQGLSYMTAAISPYNQALSEKMAILTVC